MDVTGRLAETRGILSCLQTRRTAASIWFLPAQLASLLLEGPLIPLLGSLRACPPLTCSGGALLGSGSTPLGADGCPQPLESSWRAPGLVLLARRGMLLSSYPPSPTLAQRALIKNKNMSCVCFNQLQDMGAFKGKESSVGAGPRAGRLGGDAIPGSGARGAFMSASAGQILGQIRA